MKKTIFLLALVLMLSLTLFEIPARADSSIYTNLGSYTAGSAMDQPLAITEEGTAHLTEGQLPDGCQLVSSPSGDGMQHRVTGTPVTPGNYDFTVQILRDSDEVLMTVHCSLSVISSAPVIRSSSGDVQTSLYTPVTIAVQAVSPDSGELSYQWYVNYYEKSNENGQQLSGETSSQLTLNAAEAGTRYYYCEVANRSGETVSAVRSKAITVSVLRPEVQSIRIASLPAVTGYRVNDHLRTEGLSIAVRYNDGSEEILSSGFEVDPLVLSATGDQTVTVSYLGMTCAFFVEVQQANAPASAIGISSLPYKTTYKAGEAPDLSGLILKVYTGSSSYEIASGYTVSPEVFTAPGPATVTLSYEGVSCTFSVTVEPPAADRISVKIMPKLLTFRVGETLDTTGLVITVFRGENTKDIITGFTCTPNVLDRAGAQEITVTYEDQTCTFFINVEDPAADKPSVTAPVSTIPVPTSQIISTVPRPAEKEESHSSILPIVLIAAVLLLAALCVLTVFAGNGNTAQVLTQLLEKIRRS